MNRTPLPPAIKFVLATMLVNSIGFGIIIPSFPQLIMSLGHVSLSRAIAIGGWLSLTYALFQFLFGPVMGNLSDRFGWDLCSASLSISLSWPSRQTLPGCSRRGC